MTPVNLRNQRVSRHITELAALLGSDPTLRSRYDACQRGRLSCPDLEESMSPDLPVSLRIPASLLADADALIPAIGDDPKVRALLGGPPSRAAVLRLAIVFGLDALRAKYVQP
jgi:hypothetical protein